MVDLGAAVFEQDRNHKKDSNNASVGIAPARLSVVLHSLHVGQHTTDRPKITTKPVSSTKIQ